MTTTKAIPRGVGLPDYRPRKPPAALVLDGGLDGSTAVLVLRTHDESEAHDLAARAVAMEGIDPKALDSRTAHCLWVKHVPWDESGSGFDSSWITCSSTERGAIAAIEWRLRGDY